MGSPNCRKSEKVWKGESGVKKGRRGKADVQVLLLKEQRKDEQKDT